MIILINGAFGVGKSTTAERLVEVLPNAMLYDPEYVGMLARALTKNVRFPHEETDDFQDIALWRSLTVATAHHVYEQYHRTLVVPMTIVNPAYFDAIRTGFASIAPLYHFCLTAPLAVVQQRLRQRGDGPDSWAWHRAEQCVRQFAAPYYQHHIATADVPVENVVNHIITELVAS